MQTEKKLFPEVFMLRKIRPRSIFKYKLEAFKCFFSLEKDVECWCCFGSENVWYLNT
jgi:hypothetical protein